MTEGPETSGLIEEIREEFPRFRIIRKSESRLNRAIDRALRLLTFGGQREYMSQYHTVLGDTLYVPTAWDDTSDVDRAIVLRHERVHLRQKRRLTYPVMTLLYLLPILPIGLALGRARLEWEAYRETIRATADYYGMERANSGAMRAKIVGRFTGPAYGWMWPFRGAIERWYDQVIEELRAETGSSAGAETR